MGLNVPAGAPPLPHDPNASVTSREQGGDLDLVRDAIQALQLYAECPR